MEAMTDAALVQAGAEEMRAAQDAGVMLPLHLRPSSAFQLLGILQLALRHPGLSGAVRDFATQLARLIEDQICKTPAMREMARRGWSKEYDRKSEQQETQAAAAEPVREPTKAAPKRAEDPKQGNRRARK